MGNDLHSRLGKTHKFESLSRFFLSFLLNDRLRLHICCSIYIFVAYSCYVHYDFNQVLILVVKIIHLFKQNKLSILFDVHYVGRKM